MKRAAFIAIAFCYQPLSTDMDSTSSIQIRFYVGISQNQQVHQEEAKHDLVNIGKICNIHSTFFSISAELLPVTGCPFERDERKGLLAAFAERPPAMEASEDLRKDLETKWLINVNHS